MKSSRPDRSRTSTVLTMEATMALFIVSETLFPISGIA